MVDEGRECEGKRKWRGRREIRGKAERWQAKLHETTNEKT